ncbi:hypothetical protein [Stenotrophomonas geniculata]|uniref:hypothetical protein n=1 Tax=Stenotrophomonas geniculata TaxID=86188 RepID=UPI002E76FA1D|nr:hypothetical protein [Stenotrophomonas geniculata]
MNLEQIDTSTTAGKIRVMELATQGRKVAYCARSVAHWTSIDSAITWNWLSCDYAIIADPVGPEEVWHVVHADGRTSSFDCQAEAERWAKKHGIQAVRYIRADLAGEKG